MLGYEQVIGHEQIKEYFKMAAVQKKASHAYLVNGEKGSGREMLARVFAAALQCEKEGEVPCGTCKSCKQADSGNHPDIVWVTHEKKSIGVDAVRDQINNTVDIKPYQSPYKIYIMLEADKMTDQAQNALLKTIEEPPPYAVVLLLTENTNRLLPTILSRCVTLYLEPIPEGMVKEYLIKKCKVPDYVAEMSALFAQGNVGRAVRYAASPEFLEMKEEVMLLLKHLDQMKIHEMIDVIKRIKDRRSEVKDYIDLMVLWYRDVLLFKVTKDINHLIFKGEYKYIAQEARIRDYEKLDEIIHALEKAKIRLDANVNFDITMELMLLTLKEN